MLIIVITWINMNYWWILMARDTQIHLCAAGGSLQIISSICIPTDIDQKYFMTCATWSAHHHTYTGMPQHSSSPSVKYQCVFSYAVKQSSWWNWWWWNKGNRGSSSQGQHPCSLAKMKMLFIISTRSCCTWLLKEVRDDSWIGITDLWEKHTHD